MNNINPKSETSLTQNNVNTPKNKPMTEKDWIEHHRTKDSLGRSRFFPKGEFIEGGFPEE